MPKVLTKKKSTAGKEYICTKCGKRVEPGTMYHEWSFRFGGTYRQHEGCGRPKPSQLTRSKLSSVYAAVEGAEDDIQAAQEPDDIASVLDSVAEEVETVKSEYEEAVEAMGAAGESGESQERVDALESFYDELQSAADDIRGEEEPEAEEEDDDADDDETGEKIEESEDEKEKRAAAKEKATGEKREEWLADLRDRANDALGSLSV